LPVFAPVCAALFENDDIVDARPFQGFVEDYTMSIQDGEETSDDEGGSDGEGISYVPLLEGTRSQRGQSSFKICADALQQLEDEVLNTGAFVVLFLDFLRDCAAQRSPPARPLSSLSLNLWNGVLATPGASLQAVLRFLVLCTRMESRKCQGRAGSVTAGYDSVEDAEAMRKFLCEFTCDGPSAAKPAKAAGSAKRSRDSAPRKGTTKKAKVAGR
jgi:hypothetical protein